MSVHDTSSDEQLRNWLSGPRARLLLRREHTLLRDELSMLTGVRLLQIGAWGLGPELLAHAGTLCQWRLARWPTHADDIGFDGANLPIASASVDALLLTHSLDLAVHPHQLLRESERVLNDRGQLLVLGFNPVSPWALAQRVPGRGPGRFVRNAHFYAAGRVCDWLRLLGFTPQRLVRYGAGFPFAGYSRSVPGRARDGWRVPHAWAAQAYLVVARKRVVPLTRIRWRDKKAVTSASGKIGLANHGARRVNSR